MDGVNPVQTGDTFTIPGLGTVRFTVDAENFSIRNDTLPDHALHQGSVTRSVIQIGNDVYIQTFGEGVGAMGTVNEAFSIPLWQTVDQQVINRTPLFPRPGG